MFKQATGTIIDSCWYKLNIQTRSAGKHHDIFIFFIFIYLFLQSLADTINIQLSIALQHSSIITHKLHIHRILEGKERGTSR